MSAKGPGVEPATLSDSPIATDPAVQPLDLADCQVWTGAFSGPRDEFGGPIPPGYQEVGGFLPGGVGLKFWTTVCQDGFIDLWWGRQLVGGNPHEFWNMAEHVYSRDGRLLPILGDMNADHNEAGVSLDTNEVPPGATALIQSEGGQTRIDVALRDLGPFLPPTSQLWLLMEGPEVVGYLNMTARDVPNPDSWNGGSALLYSESRVAASGVGWRFMVDGVHYTFANDGASVAG
jgi:hypothetical protein